MSSPLEQRLKELSEHSSWRLDDGVREETRKRLLLLEAQNIARPVSWVDGLMRFPHELTEFVSRPYAIVSLVIVMMLGGWITSVNASLDTLPGDTFYPVKIASERAQITFANTQTRGRLRAEFASRRLSEVTTLVESGTTDKDVRIQVALEGFEKQIDAARDDLKKSPSDAQAVELVRLINQSKTALDQAISVSESALDETSTTALVASQGRADAVHSDAVGVLSTTAAESSVSANELSRQFTNEVRDILATTTVLSRRLDLVASVIETTERTDIDLDVAAERRALLNVDVSGAQDFAARGGYPRAFEITKAIQRHLRDVELAVARAEIALTRPIEASETEAPSTDEPVVEDGNANSEEMTIEDSEEEVEPETVEPVDGEVGE